jgi:hypothetical protein
MGLSLSTSGGTQTGAAATVTITIPANSAVGLLAELNGSGGMGYHQGSVSDTGSNSYTAAGGANPSGGAYYSDAFYCLNTGSSATSITYTPSGSYTTLFSVNIVAWVWTVTGGTATFGSQVTNFQSAVGTGTDAVTTGSVTCATGSVVMGCAQAQFGSNVLSAGTGFTQDYAAFGTGGEHGAFSSNHAATWTDSNGTEQVCSQAMSFGLSASGVPVAWWV